MSKKENKKVEKTQEEKVSEVVEETIENEEKVEDSQPDIDALIQVEKDKFLRLFAEFENFKKRTSRERLDLFKTANKELMTVLLPILDDFERALSEIKKSKDNDLSKGVDLIYSKLKNTLEQKGLSLVEAKAGDTFDPEIHQAVTQIPAPSKKMKGKIIDVTEKGYKLGETFIRYPKVVVGQ